MLLCHITWVTLKGSQCWVEPTKERWTTDPQSGKLLWYLKSTIQQVKSCSKFQCRCKVWVLIWFGFCFVGVLLLVLVLLLLLLLLLLWWIIEAQQSKLTQLWGRTLWPSVDGNFPLKKWILTCQWALMETEYQITDHKLQCNLNCPLWTECCLT